MITNDSLFSKVTAIYDRRRLDAADRVFETNQKMNADPAFAANKEKLKNASFMRQKAEFQGDEKAAEKYRAEYEKLKAERKKILAEKGLSEQDLIVGYRCKKCGDTGFLPHGGNCECFYKTLKEVINDSLGITERTLPSFGGYETESKQEEKTKAKLISYCEKFPELAVRNLIFTGTTGTGKTFAAGCVANEITKKHANVIFLTAVKANDLFLRYHTSGEADRKAMFSLLTESDLLVIDDLGTEPVLKNVTTEYLTSFLSERLANKKPFIITTNLTPAEMINRYTERLVSRLSGSDTAIIPFEGNDKRRKK